MMMNQIIPYRLSHFEGAIGYLPQSFVVTTFPANAFPNTTHVNRSHRRLATTTLSCSRTPKSALTRWTIS